MSSKIHIGDEVHKQLSNGSYRDGVVLISDCPKHRKAPDGGYLIDVDDKVYNVHPLVDRLDGPFLGWGIRFEVIESVEGYR